MYLFSKHTVSYTKQTYIYIYKYSKFLFVVPVHCKVAEKLMGVLQNRPLSVVSTARASINRPTLLNC